MDTCEVNGIRIAVTEQGMGTPLLLVHGFPLDHTMWNGQITHFSASHRVIAPDLRGFGESEATAGTVTMDEFADDLVALLEAVGVDEPVVLCGLSMGGYVAMAFARRYADRLRGLILCDTRSDPDSPEAAQTRRETADNVEAEGSTASVVPMLSKLFSESTFQAQGTVVALTREVILGTKPEAFAAAARGMAERVDSTPSLQEIGCPTLVVVGADDAISPPEEMRRMADAIPNASFCEIPTAGHMSPLEKPAEVNQAVETFLAKIGA